MHSHPPVRVPTNFQLWPGRRASSTTATWVTSARRSSTTSIWPMSDPDAAAAIDELLASERFTAFGPDTLAEARNRGYRPHRGGKS